SRVPIMRLAAARGTVRANHGHHFIFIIPGSSHHAFPPFSPLPFLPSPPSPPLPFLPSLAPPPRPSTIPPGARFPIVLYFGAVGVTVSNNYVHDFIFAGIVCGAFVSYVGDCMLSTISNNLVVATGRNISGDMDASGIYFNTHWFNPGNLAECNYVIGGDQCYYLDFASSGVTIRGGACIDTYAGMKVNNGKSNVIEDVVVKNTRWTPGWSTCLTAEVVNCGKKPGSYWEQMRRKYYNSAQMNQNWPWMQTVCSEMGVNGVPCNSNARGTLNATLTGKCSGLPTRNSLMLVLVGALDYDMDFKYCEDLPNTPRINSHRYINVTNVADAQFLDFVEDDLGVKRGSSLYKTRPNFKSCPRSEVGPKKLLERSYYENFNKAIPDVYYVTLGMGTLHIHDPTLLVDEIRKL
ncbi:unnamed protein product, partial [Closterium sp. NIES-54]